MAVVRPVDGVVTAHQQTEGGGFVVRRPFPTRGLDHLDPLLMLDEMGPVTYGPGEAIGAPDHPHRGFETVTYLLEGELEHADSAGHAGSLSAGDVQWMTAGAGIVHREMPSRRVQAEGGTVHGFQLWVNLPKADKGTAPRYQEISARSIPSASTPDGRASVKVLAGEALGVSAVIATRTPIVVHHWRLQPGAAVTTPIPADHTLAVYVFAGTVTVAGTAVGRGQLAVLGAGDAVSLAAPSGATEEAQSEEAQCLVLGGRPLREPIAWGGPFVMNRRDEVAQAYEDFRAGRMGTIPAEIIRS
ncbi:MAG: pirin family protein [Myxococcota bacterium]